MISPKQQRFVDEYLVDLNATQAAIRAGYSAKTAQEQGARLLSNVMVAAEIQKAVDKRSARTEITQDMVLQRWWDIATADPNELIQFRWVCCRYCYGVDHEYQWADENEYIEALSRQTDEDEPLSDAGGYGFNPKAEPHAECPSCHGEGHGHTHALDTRKVQGKAKLLYAGVKQTKEGLEIKLHDQGKALENVARHLGMFIERKEVGAPGDFERLNDDELQSAIEEAERAIDAARSSTKKTAAPKGTAKKTV